MTLRNRTGVAAAAAAALAIIAGLTAGCGGGGGGGGNTPPPPPPTTFTIHGLLLNNGAALSGVTVRYDGNATYTATTAADGSFAFVVPATAVTGADYAAVYYPVGAAAIKKPIPETAGVPGDIGSFDIHVAPPATYSIHGTLLNSGVPVVGVTIKFDDLAAYTTVTDGSGKFTLTIPQTATTGSDFASIYLVTGSLPVHKAIKEIAKVPADLGTLDVGLPPPPLP